MTQYSPKQLIPLYRYLKSNHYDLIDVHLFPAQLWAVLAIILVGKQIPLITREHNTYNRRRRLFFYPLDYGMYSNFDKIICVGEATAHALIKWLPYTKEKVEVVHNGINQTRFYEAEPYDLRSEMGLPVDSVRSWLPCSRKALQAQDRLKRRRAD